MLLCLTQLFFVSFFEALDFCRIFFGFKHCEELENAGFLCCFE